METDSRKIRKLVVKISMGLMVAKTSMGLMMKTSMGLMVAKPSTAWRWWSSRAGLGGRRRSLRTIG